MGRTNKAHVSLFALEARRQRALQRSSSPVYFSPWPSRGPHAMMALLALPVISIRIPRILPPPTVRTTICPGFSPDLAFLAGKRMMSRGAGWSKRAEAIIVCRKTIWLAARRWRICMGVCLLLVSVCATVTPVQSTDLRQWFDLTRWRDPRDWPFIPLPEVATDPNGDTTMGLLPVWLFTDDKDQIRQMFAPDLTYNPTLGFGGTLRFFSYPSDDTQWYIVAGGAETIDRDIDFFYSTGRTRQKPLTATSTSSIPLAVRVGTGGPLTAVYAMSAIPLSDSSASGKC